MIENEPVVRERALEEGRAAYANRAWPDAFEALSRANREQPLEPPDLELLARSAYMLGLDARGGSATTSSSSGRLHPPAGGSLAASGCSLARIASTWRAAIS